MGKKAFPLKMKPLSALSLLAGNGPILTSMAQGDGPWGMIRSAGQSFMKGMSPKVNEPNVETPEPPAPTPPEPDLTAEEIATRGSEARSGMAGLMAPGYLGIDQDMSSLQRRTRVATQATSGELGQDATALKYYRNLAFGSLTEPGAEGPTDIEQQYISNTYGEPIKTKDTPGFLSALERIYKRQ